jgi:hypothetical protein
MLRVLDKLLHRQDDLNMERCDSGSFVFTQTLADGLYVGSPH